MAYRLIIWDEKLWAKDVSKIDPKRVRVILDRITKLQNEPWPGDVQVKKLQDFAMADFRLRVGDYRILFDRDLEKKTIVLYRVLHRSKSYL